MYRIVRKEPLNPSVTRMSIEAPLVARKVQPGQFIILRVEENGERIPLTVAGYDRPWPDTIGMRAPWTSSSRSSALPPRS